MSITTIAPNEDAYAQRWGRWQLGYADSSRKTAMRARIGITVILTALGAWLGLQLLSSQLWA